LTAGWCQVGRGLLEKRRAGSATNTPALEAPEGTQTQTQDTTDQAPRQVEIVAVYEADGAGGLARIHDDGKLAEYKADGQAADPPAGTLKDLYHWLEAHGYTPAGFQWLDRGPGNRCRRQVYVLGGVYRDWHAAAVVYDGPGSDGLEPATETEAAAVAEAGRRYRERKLVFCLEAEARLRWQNRGQVRACPLLTQKGKVR
jgi:hypothetical protein